LDVIHTLVLAWPDSIQQFNDDKQKPVHVFEQYKHLWKDDNTQKTVEKLVNGGIDDVQFHDDYNGIAHNTIHKDPSVKFIAADTTQDSDFKDSDSVLSVNVQEEGWKQSGLIVVIIGASGDLAKKKTYPSLLHLYAANLLPADTLIYGFARSDLTHEQLRQRLQPHLEKAAESSNYSTQTIQDFLSKCYYQRGVRYGDTKAFQSLVSQMKTYESQYPSKLSHNRLFYFAVPPNVFAEAGVAIKQNSCISERGWTRLVIEKPFGRDLQSCEELLSIMGKNFDEENLYRIDHYLGKEMVQNLLVLRFGNGWFEKLWDRDSIQCVILTFKEPFGTEGRGGYFDNYGIIRDIIQNHLLQVLTLLAMEAPIKADGAEAGQSIRDAKCAVLKSIPPIDIEDCVLGQYEGYTDDETIENKDSNCPTYAAIHCRIRNPRWAGIPFILKAGKALDERKAEMRIQFKDAPASEFLFDDTCPRNELVMRMQPDEAIYFKTNVKTPGFSTKPLQSELEVNYSERFDMKNSSVIPDSYTRLILDVIRGKAAAFVREDELRRSWEIFTPLLHKIESENIKPHVYKRGTRGPAAADVFVKERSGYVRNLDYVFSNGKVSKKTH